MSEKEILYDVKDYVATITINRPKTLNAFTGDNIVEMERLILEATADKTVGVIVLTGSGERAFCVGGDVNWEKDAGGKSGLEGLKFNFNRHIVECPKPVIARVNGYAIGGGHHIAYFCDFTIAAEHAIFGQNGPRVGSPAGATSSRTAPMCLATSARESSGCWRDATPPNKRSTGDWPIPSFRWPNLTSRCGSIATNSWL